MNRNRHTLLACIALFAGMMLCSTVHAQIATISGQVRERTEFDGKSFTPNTHLDVYHLLRTRLAATATIADWLTATVEVQDSRTFGQTRATLNGSAPALDLRQGNIEVKDIAGTSVNMKLGRQVLNYANERLIGRSDWNNFGQSFDGIFLTVPIGDVKLDAFGAATARNPNTSDSTGPIYTRDAILSGLWAMWKPEKGTVGAQAFLLYDSPGTTTRDNRQTAGVYVNGTADALDFEVDGAYQFGTRVRKGSPDRTIGAYLAGLRVGYTIESAAGLRIGVGFDRLSGLEENAPDKFGAFNTLYGTNHRFYGHIDIVDNTTQRLDLGLNDPFVQISITPWKATRFGVDVHLLSTASDPTKVLAGVPAGKTTAIGKELDITMNYTPVKPFNFTCGYAVFDGDPNRYLAQGRKTIQWGFAMCTVTW